MRSNKNKRRYVNRPPKGVCIDAPSGHLLRLEKKKKKYTGGVWTITKGEKKKLGMCELGVRTEGDEVRGVQNLNLGQN